MSNGLERFLVPGARLLNVALAGLTVMVAVRLVPDNPPVIARPTVAPHRTAAPSSAGEVDAVVDAAAIDVAAIVSRGLFGREAAPDTDATAVTDASGDVAGPPPALVGTALTPRGAAAIFVESGQQVLVAEGEPIDGEWRLVAVRRGRAIVEDSAGRRLETELVL